MRPPRPISAAARWNAVELMNVGVNYMREHMPSDARVHYALLDTGGIAPNVVQAHARVRYSIRARDLPGMNELVERVHKIAQCGADDRDQGGDEDHLRGLQHPANTPLEEALYGIMEELGPRISTRPTRISPDRSRRP